MNPVKHGGYIIHPVAVRLSENDWRAIVIIAPATADGKAVRNYSKLIKVSPLRFDNEQKAEKYALEYGKTLVTGNEAAPPAVH